MSVMITGSDGYLGSIASQLLLRKGYDVVGVDSGLYYNSLYYPREVTPFTLHRDTRNLAAEDLEGIDAVVAMADLSNDTLGEISVPITEAINYEAVVRLAKLARQSGVHRFVYMSSCAVYGAPEGEVDEMSPTAPLTTYARCKAMVEQELSALASSSFHPTVLRNATAFGASPKLRFDLVVNNLAASAWCDDEVRLRTAGQQWRPLVHAQDIARAIALVLDSDTALVHDKVFNVGSNALNMRVSDIANRVSASFDDVPVRVGAQDSDHRSYRVRFDRIEDQLGYHADRSIESGLEELRNVFATVGLTREWAEGVTGVRLRQLQSLIGSNRVDEALMWRYVG